MKKLCSLLIVIYYCLGAANYTSVNAQDGIVWKYKTAGIITSSPLIYNGKVFCGSDDSYLYCRDAQNGEAVWNYKADTSVLSSPVVSNGIVFFESGNILYALNANNGDEIWKFDPHADTLAYKIDPWDYHHGSPVVDDTIVYYGCSNGSLYGVEIATGNEVLQYQTVNRSAIRSTPLIHDGVLFFGDWHSRIYALDIAVQDTLWTYETVIPIPYETFGAFVTELIEFNNSLYFGSRNNTIRAVDITTGIDKWSIYDPSNSWMPGNPVIYDSILYIGGSDNHGLWALNANTGEIVWKYPVEQNIFSRPIVFDDFIIVSSGLSGTAGTPNPYSNGYLHLIDRTTGALRNKFMTDGNIFSSPVINHGIIYFGSNDSALYAIDSAYLFRPIPMLSFEDEGNINLGEITEDAVAIISIMNTGDIADTLGIEVTSSNTLPEGTFDLSVDYLIINSEQSGSLQVTIHPQELETGNYSLIVRFSSNELNWFKLNKRISFRVPAESSTDERDEHKILIYPNPANDFINFSDTEQIIRIEIYSSCGMLIKKESVFGSQHKIDIGFLEKGTYLLKLISVKGEVFSQIIIL